MKTLTPDNLSTCCRPLHTLHILQMRNTVECSRAPEILLLGVRTSYFESRHSRSNLKLGKKRYFRFSIISIFIPDPLKRSHIWLKIACEIEPKSDPKSFVFVSFSKAVLSENKKEFASVKVETKSFRLDQSELLTPNRLEEPVF